MSKPWFWISVLILCLSFHIRSSFGALTAISANQSISGDQTLISQEGAFELGFFKPGNSSNYYIGMWYKKVSKRTYVWVANRNKPVHDKYSATLAISNGNLVLFDGSQNNVWSTNLTAPFLSFVEAVFLDTGNLVLRDRTNATDKFLWQSFDNPSDTWLPGSKIRLNNKTKQPQYLTSWKNDEDPAEGLFSLELDPKGSTAYYILWNKSQQYWSSGHCNGPIFSFVLDMRLNYIYNFTSETNENESSSMTQEEYND